MAAASRRSHVSRSIWSGVLTVLCLSACATTRDPAVVGMQYAQAVYARDFRQAHSFLSAEDRRATIDAETFARQYGQAEGFGLEIGRRLASAARMVSAYGRVGDGTATVSIRVRYPDADHPDVFDILRGRDGSALVPIPPGDQEKLRAQVDGLLRAGKFPFFERDEKFSLVREGDDWRVRQDYARKGIRIRFRVVLSEGLPLEAIVSPAEVVILPGERFFVNVTVKNRADGRLVSRMDHDIVPDEQSRHLALVECLSLVFLRPGETERQVSEYMLLGTAERGPREFDVIYRFSPVEELGRGEKEKG